MKKIFLQMHMNTKRIDLFTQSRLWGKSQQWYITIKEYYIK